MIIEYNLALEQLRSSIETFWEISGPKIRSLEKDYNVASGSPVFTANGKYTSKGWTEWTQGFQYGCSIIQFDATGEEQFIHIAKKNTIEKMASHVSHFGVHDHGFNVVSTYGNLHRLMGEGKIPENNWERHFYELAIKVSGAVQAKRWTRIDGGGYIYSFNGPHSLFVDTIRTIRVLMLGHRLKHTLMDENDLSVSLLERALIHAKTTAKYAVYYGEGRDIYDIEDRVVHESIFNINDGYYRCPNAQQGYSGFSTWTRGLSWAMLGFSEELEFIGSLEDHELQSFGGKSEIEGIFLKAAKAACNCFIEKTATDGIPFWDTGAPLLYKMTGKLYEKPSDPYNDIEPVDSSAAVIGAQGLIRLGKYLMDRGDTSGSKYYQAGLTTAKTVFNQPYLSMDPNHQGLILHSIYHRPNGWDYMAKGNKIPKGESSMWGDYHAMELALLLQRLMDNEKYYTFFGGVEHR